MQTYINVWSGIQTDISVFKQLKAAYALDSAVIVIYYRLFGYYDLISIKKKTEEMIL
jgi:hypothetical protein